MLKGVNFMVQSSIALESRRDQLLSMLRRDGSISLAEAAATLGISEMTVRRDLQEMEQNGMARRVRGGAVAVGPERFQRRSGMASAAKQVIAKKLVSLAPHSGTMALDASSTIHQFALVLEPRDITVLCTGMETMGVLSQSGKVRVLLSGGEVEETTGALVGSLALRTIEQFVFTRSFVSPTCVHPDFGLMESTIEGSDIKRAISNASTSLVVAADSTKLGGTSMARTLSLENLEFLVTELDPRDSRLDPYRDQVELL